MKWIKLKAINMSLRCKLIPVNVNNYVLTSDGPGLAIVSLLESSCVWAAAGCSCSGLLTDVCWVELDASLICGNVLAAAVTVTFFVVEFQ